MKTEMLKLSDLAVAQGNLMLWLADQDHDVNWNELGIEIDWYVLLSTPNDGYFLSDRPRFSDRPDASPYEAMQFRSDTNGHLKTAFLHRVLPAAVINGFEWVTRRLPEWITRRSHTAMAVLLQRSSEAVSRT